MKTKKYFAQQLAFNIFRISLYGLATVIPLYLIFISSQPIKNAFIETNAYNRFVPLNIEASIALGQDSGQVLITDPAVQQVIIKSFPNTKLQIETEKVIDSTYAWLNGQTKKPDFVVDFTPNVDLFAKNLSTYGVERLQSLPICKEVPETLDPFTATCKPAKLNYAAEQESLESEIRANNGILTQTVFTVDDLPKTSDGKTLIEQYSYAPTIYRALLFAPYVLLVTTVTSAIVAILLDRKKRYATRRVGTSIIGATLFLIISPIFYIYILPYFFPSLSVDTSAGGGSVVFGDVISKLGLAFSNQLIIASSVMLSVGIAILLVERITRPKSKYVKLNKKSGLLSSDVPHNKNKQGKAVLTATTVPIQTSEGKKQSSKYQKDKRYRKIAKKEF